MPTIIKTSADRWAPYEHIARTRFLPVTSRTCGSQGKPFSK
uniref:Uncharacterized protein n=1 Tax=Arundo donax TaxID=35708 RepID=A0A0A9A7K9_ARUDO